MREKKDSSSKKTAKSTSASKKAAAPTNALHKSMLALNSSMHKKRLRKEAVEAVVRFMRKHSVDETATLFEEATSEFARRTEKAKKAAQERLKKV